MAAQWGASGNNWTHTCGPSAHNFSWNRLQTIRCSG